MTRRLSLDSLHGCARRSPRRWPLTGSLSANPRRSIRSTPRTSTSLEVAWRFKTDNLGTSRVQARRHAADGRTASLYATAGTRRSVVALDAHRRAALGPLASAKASAAATRRASFGPRPRALDRWPGRRAHHLRHARLPAGRAQRQDRPADQDVRQGRRRRSEGRRRLRQRTSRSISRPARSASTRRRRSSTTSSHRLVDEGRDDRHDAQQHQGARPRVRRAHRQAALDLQHHSAPGEFGNDTWHNNSWAINGNVGVWTQISVDEELGLVYLPVETPTSDYYGGKRPGNNLFAESLVCVDLKTGKRKWHFQFVHHPIWNYDMSSAPILLDVTVNGSRARSSPSRASRRGSTCSIA